MITKGMCFVYVRHRSGLIRFVVADYKMLWTDIYLNRVWAKVYEIRVFKV